MFAIRPFAFVAGVALCALPAFAQQERTVPDLHELAGKPQSEVADAVHYYEADRGSLQRTYLVPSSPARLYRMLIFNLAWDEALGQLKSHQFSKEGQADYAKLTETVQRELKQIDEQARRQEQIAPLVPFAPIICNLEEARRQKVSVDSQGSAGQLVQLTKLIGQRTKDLEQHLKTAASSSGPESNKSLVILAAETTASLRSSLRSWFSFYNGYDPLFTWWMAEPYKEADAALQSYATFLRDKVAAKAGDAKSDLPKDSAWARNAARAPLAIIPSDVPDLLEIVKTQPSEMRPVIQRFMTDRGSMGRLAAAVPNAPVPPRTPERSNQVRKYYQDWLDAMQKIDFDKLSQTGKVDYVLLRNLIDHEVRRVDLQSKLREEAAKFTAFESAASKLAAAAEHKEKMDATKAIEALKGIQDQVATARKLCDSNSRELTADIAANAARSIAVVKLDLSDWRDALAKDNESWEKDTKGAYQATRTALDQYATFLRSIAAKSTKKDDSGIEGRPIGRDALLAEFAFEMLPYTPEDLIAIAHHEFAWCEAEMKKASRDMGFGDDWKKAVEKVKTLHVDPGKQPDLIRDLSREAVDYVRRQDLVTVPPMADETWRMEMMSPQRQLVSPFFTGGEVISIAFPTNTMAYDARLQSLRGNNIHFSRATVHHELIPGHHLQGFMTARYKTYRGPFGTSFWTEGGALYWEFVLYDMGFPRTPEDKVGFLFWRMHRCARIIFSLNYHLRNWTPQQCIDFLVDKVGHERDNAAAEVRRSFGGGYGPLYQLSYMMGGLQLRALHKEIVETGKMAERQYNDAVLKEGRIPIAMLRAALTGMKLTRDYRGDWEFYGPSPAKNHPRSEAP